MNRKGQVIFGGVALIAAIVVIMKVVGFIMSKIIFFSVIALIGYFAYTYFKNKMTTKKN